MGTSERARDRGRRRGRELQARLGRELRMARIGAGLSQRAVAAAVGLSHAQIGRLERGESRWDVLVAAQIFAVLGLELGVAVHPVSSPLRDKGHLALLGRFARRLHPSFRWRTEVALPIPGDLRAIDGWLDNRACRAMVEAETRLVDAQACERRARLKQRDAGNPRLILLLADTRFNRDAVDAIPDLAARFPVSGRKGLSSLARGEDPGGDSLLLL